MTNTTSSKPNIVESYEEGKLNEWLSQHGRTIVYGMVVAILLLIIAYRLVSSYTGKQEQTFFQASQDFAAFTRTSTSQDPAAGMESLDNLVKAMSAHPELHAAYDGAIAQTLINRNLAKEAKPYVTSTLSRTRTDDLPLYAEFSTTTLLIAEGQYAEALSGAQALQKQMTEAINTKSASERGFGDELFAVNLFRIGMLQQQQGDAKGELKTWEEWKQYAGLDSGKTPETKVNSQAFRNVIQQLAIGTFSLPDYIAYRTKELTSKK